ncbi:MAG: hypothetical protein QOF48_2571 [Verrucomicrobiota bacterium]|jgi:uncharacterized membrane protein YqjE
MDIDQAEEAGESLGDLLGASGRVARRTLDIGANRVELLMVEVQEERERLLRSFHIALAAAAFGILGGFALTFALAVLLWEHGAVAALFCTAGICLGVTIYLAARVNGMQRDTPMFGATMDQLRKDRACFDAIH